MWPFRTDLALLALIAVQPLEQAFPPNAISPTNVAGVICLVTLILAVVGALTLSEQFYAPIWITASLATLLDAQSGNRVGPGS